LESGSEAKKVRAKRLEGRDALGNRSIKGTSEPSGEREKPPFGEGRTRHTGRREKK